MSRYGGARHSSDDLAYGEDAPSNRWDRDRFERFRRGPEAEQRETIRISERDTPRRTEVRIEEREREVPRRAPGRLRDERDFEFLQEERYGPPARIPRRSDRDLFGDVDPREIAERQLAPYRRKSIVEREIEIERRGPERRPGLMRRQSSLDTFDRKPVRREYEEYRLPPNVPIPLPIRRSSPARSRRGDYEEFEDIHYREYSPHGYRDMEVMREKSRVRKRGKSDLRSNRSVSVSNRSDSTESFEEISRYGSPSPERKVGKKGKTRMPKRLVRKEAIVQLGYPFEEEDDFIIVRRALEKDQIDEVIRISEQYKESQKAPKTTTYRFEETIEEQPRAPEEHYETLRTEWINPPSVRAPSVRAPSPARSSRTRRSSPARTMRAATPPPAPIYIQQPAPPPPRETVYIQQPAPPPPRETVYIQQQAPPPPIQVPTPQQPMTLILPERHRHNDRDIKAEIRALEAEQRALRYERAGNMQLAHRPHDEYEVVEFRERRPDRHGGELVEYVERREKSPKRETVRVEKDRKEKRVNPKLVAAMMATLT